MKKLLFILALLVTLQVPAQKLIGGKGNKNGVAVSAIYGGGISAGLLKPYYLQIQNFSYVCLLGHTVNILVGHKTIQ